MTTRTSVGYVVAMLALIVAPSIGHAELDVNREVTTDATVRCARTFWKAANGTLSPAPSYTCGGVFNRRGGSVNVGEASAMTPDTTADDSLYLYNRGYDDWTPQSDSLTLIWALDTLELYVQRHPFATTELGMTLQAVEQTGQIVGQLGGGADNIIAKERWNWLVDAQTWNSDTAYQKTVLWCLVNMPWDRNEAMNMAYNYSLWFTDPASQKRAWETMRDGRDYQKGIGEDTTAFHILTLPLKKIPIPGQSFVHAVEAEGMQSLSLAPNPVRTTLLLKFETSMRGEASIAIYDVLGRPVKVVFSGVVNGGIHELPVSVTSLTAGHYLVRLETSQGAVTRLLEVTR